jgi:tubulin-folding cofactor B
LIQRLLEEAKRSFCQKGTTVLFRHPTMALRTTADVTVLINSENSSTAERRVTPSWTISQLKTKLLPVTGIPPSAQQLTLRLPHAPQPITIASEDEENTQIAVFPLQPYCEIHVCVL